MSFNRFSCRSMPNLRALCFCCYLPACCCCCCCYCWHFYFYTKDSKKIAWKTRSWIKMCNKILHHQTHTHTHCFGRWLYFTLSPLTAAAAAPGLTVKIGTVTPLRVPMGRELDTTATFLSFSDSILLFFFHFLRKKKKFHVFRVSFATSLEVVCCVCVFVCVH